MKKPIQFRKPNERPEKAAKLTALERAWKIHQMMEDLLGSAFVTKALFSAAADTTVEFNTVEPLLVAGTAICENQRSEMCAVINMLCDLEVQLEGVKA